MRIGQLTSNFHPIGPASQRAIGSHVAWLANGLVAKGHDVHVFAASESETTAQLHAVSPALSTLGLTDDLIRNYMLLNVSQGYEYGKQHLDIIHSHFNLYSSYFSRISEIPTITSIHSPITERSRPFLEFYKNERHVSFSLAQRKQMPELNWYANIYHGVDMNIFSFKPESDDYLLYLGRITEDKGVHFAIEAAKAVGAPLRIVGASYPNEGYWQKYIEPHIDGTQIRYLGEASFERKIELFQNAKALLFPTLVAEAFGYSMIEAMACGTPVIGFNNGSVSEIVQDGVTGFVVENAAEMATAVSKIGAVDRARVRSRAERYFSVEKMISGYEKIYQRILADTAYHAKRKSQRRLKKSVSELVARSGKA